MKSIIYVLYLYNMYSMLLQLALTPPYVRPGGHADKKAGHADVPELSPL